MADGIPCKHCGYNETLHGLVDLKFACVDENEILPDKELSLRDCMEKKGYNPEE